MGFLACYLVTLILLVGAYFTQAPVIFSLVLAFIILPLVDELVGPQINFENANSKIYRLALLGWLPCQIILLLGSIVYVSGMSFMAAISWAVPMGLLAGAFGITIGHELGHKYDPASRTSSKILFSLVCFPGFTIEHNLGHHVNVATPNDPATARYGESLWRFILRSAPQQYVDAWKIEANRIRKSRQGTFRYGIENKVLPLTLLSLAFPFIAFSIGGTSGLALFIMQAAIAVFLLQAINYVEHYGLERRLIDGKYEKVGPIHSWDANWLITNHLLFRLQQHADHHQHAQKRCGDLKPERAAPLMIKGYPTMVVLALVPPIWRRVMHPRLEKLRSRNDFASENNRRLETVS